jgi:uncharacterized membrane protein YobD (UPF0266 family)
MRQFNLFLLKYGAYIHTVLLISLLIYIEIGPKSPIFWAFLLNHILFTYFVIIRATAFGIKRTMIFFNQIEEEKTIQDDINKNN